MLSVIDDRYNFWKENIECKNYMVALPKDILREGKKFEEQSFEYSEKDYEIINAITNGDKTGMFAFLLSSVYIALRKYDLIDEVRVGIPNKLENNGYIKILPLLCTVQNKSTVREIVNQVQEKYVLLCKNSTVTEEDILFDNDIDLNTDTVVAFKGVHQAPEEDSYQLYILFSNEDNQIKGNVKYDSNTYRSGKITRFIKQLKMLPGILIEDRLKTISEVSLVTNEEQELLKHAQAGGSFEMSECNFAMKIMNHKDNNPNGIAVVDADSELTYENLWEKAGRVVSFLRKQGIRKGDVVGIQLPPVADFIVAMVAIMRLGAIYVPMDENVPNDRCKQYLADSKACLFITNNLDRDLIIPTVNIDDLYSQPVDDYMDTSVTLEDVLYILFTSGSTGKPKGAALTQRNLANLAININHTINKEGRNGLKIGQLTSFSFDPSEAAITYAMFWGYTVYVIPKSYRVDGKGLIEYINKIGFDYIVGATAHIDVLIDGNINKEKELKVGTINIGGEVFRKERARKFFQMFSVNPPRILNTYGLTETSVLSTMYEVDVDELEENVSIPIGRPIENTSVYILDENRKLLPYGAKGEIYLGGDCVGLGYVNNEKENANRLFDSVFKNGKRIFRTGDVGRWSESGHLLCEGRVDNQVKIRGYRIELAEIENTINQLPEVKETAVIVKNSSGANRLVAYVTSNGAGIDVDKITLALKKVLPEYMVPAHIIPLKEMPRNINAKIDKKSLEQRDIPKKNSRAIIKPKNDTQEKILAVWKELLGIETISIDDNFFELGGQSLMMVKMLGRLYDIFNFELTIEDIIDHQTIEELAEFIACNNSKASQIEMQKSPDKDYYELSSSQKRMYISHKLDNENTTFNTPMLLKLEGEVNESSLVEAITTTVNRHDIFKTVFVEKNNSIVQQVNKEINFAVEVKAISEEEVPQICTNCIKPFDISKGPLIRVSLFTISDKCTYLFIDMHHIISDMVTVDLFVKEVVSQYNSMKLGNVKYQFKDYVEWMEKRLESGELEKQKDYWLNEYKAGIPTLGLQADHIESIGDEKMGGTLRFYGDEALLDAIKKLSSKMGVTVQMVLISAYAIIASRYACNDTVLIGVPVAARKKAYLNDIMGPILNTVLLKIDVDESVEYTAYLSGVKKKALDAMSNQEYPLELLIDEIGKNHSIKRGSVYEISFNYYEEESIGGDCAIDGVKISSVDIDYNATHADIDMTCSIENEQINVTINYLKNLFDKSTVEYFGKHYIELLKTIVDTPEEAINQLNMYTPEELEMYSYEY